MHLESTGRQSEVVETGQPSRCPSGHPVGPRQVLVGYVPCGCGWPDTGHRTFACRECGATIYQPEYDRTVVPPPQ